MRCWRRLLKALCVQSSALWLRRGCQSASHLCAFGACSFRSPSVCRTADTRVALASPLPLPGSAQALQVVRNAVRNNEQRIHVVHMFELFWPTEGPPLSELPRELRQT